MTVRELIEQLQQYPADMKVVDMDGSEIVDISSAILIHSCTNQADNMDVWEESESVVKIV